MILYNQVLSMVSSNIDITDAMTASSQNRLFGEIDPIGFDISLSKVSHVIKNLKKLNNSIIGDIHILDTPSGNMLKTLINANLKLAVSSRTKPLSNDNYSIITYDIENNPGFSNAQLLQIEHDIWI